MGHLTFVSKRLSAVGNKRISQFFDSARAPRSRVIALVDSTWVFLLLSFLYRGICHSKCCLSEEQVQMWWDHLQQNALNRARGVEKAKATRQRKKQKKKNDTMSV